MGLAEYISNTIDLKDIGLSKSYYYNSLVFCVIDAVYSVGANYTSTLNTVKRFCHFRGVEPFREYGTTPDSISNEYTVHGFLSDLGKFSDDELACDVFRNRQRTSTRNGILKAAAVREFAMVLQEFGINQFSDVYQIKDQKGFERQVKNITGQGTGKTLSYFYMLAGDDNKIKPDRHILNFLQQAVGYIVTPEEAVMIVEDAVSGLRKEYPELTPRKLDHAIWNYDR